MDGLTLVFDLDGTLVDTAPDLICATNHVLGLRNLVPVEGDEVRPYVSFGARRMIEHALSLRSHQLPPEEVDHLLGEFLDFYVDNIAVESRPFELVPELLDAFAGRGLRLAVCTNKQEEMSRRLLTELGLADRFQAICGRDTFPVCKPHPDHLTGAISRSGGSAVRAVMVGDSETDVRTARAAKIPIIGVTFGYSDVSMRDLQADAVIDHYAEFEGALAQILPRLS
ncbi:MAG: HAD family hydrolase [Hyphomicrobiaceae bacterium]